MHSSFISYYLFELWNAITLPVQEYFDNFKYLKFDPFESKDVLLDDLNDSDKNVYKNIKAIDTQYYFPSELLSLSEKLHINSEHFSMIHVNIRRSRIGGRGEGAWYKHVHPWITEF